MPFYQNQRKNVFKKVPNLTLGKAIDIATTDEMSKAQLETMGNEDASINCVNQRKQNERLVVVHLRSGCHEFPFGYVNPT